MLQFESLLLGFWKLYEDKMPRWAKVGEEGCREASDALVEHFHRLNLDLIPIGIDLKKRKKGGFIQLDLPIYHVDFLSDEDKINIKKMKLQFDERSIEKYAKSLKIVEQFSLVPHSWVEMNDMGRTIILDPSGFYPNGRGQFDKFMKSSTLSNKRELESRYTYFN